MDDNNNNNDNDKESKKITIYPIVEQAMGKLGQLTNDPIQF